MFILYRVSHTLLILYRVDPKVIILYIVDLSLCILCININNPWWSCADRGPFPTRKVLLSGRLNSARKNLYMEYLDYFTELKAIGWGHQGSLSVLFFIKMVFFFFYNKGQFKYLYCQCRKLKPVPFKKYKTSWNYGFSLLHLIKISNGPL